MLLNIFYKQLKSNRSVNIKTSKLESAGIPITDALPAIRVHMPQPTADQEIRK